MKKFNYFVMLGISASLVLASCSQQRYAHRAKVRVNDQATEQVKKERKEVATITPKASDLVKPEPKQTEEAKALKPENAKPKPKEVLKQLTSKESRTFITEVAKDPLKFRDLLIKSDNKTKQELNSIVEDIHGNWLGFIIVGLILVLIGALMGYLFGPIGWLFHVAGAICIVIGLIFLLLELV